MADATTWAVEHAAELIGLPVARAEQAVRSAGLRPRVAEPGSAITLAFQTDRVTLEADTAGAVAAVRPG